MKFLALSAFSLVSVLTLITGCKSDHIGHSEGDDHHADSSADTAHGHEAGDDDHHDSKIGMPGDPGSVDRVFKVSMDDAMRFKPAEFDVVAGETIQFDIINNGKVAHEFVLGSASDIKEHHALMQKFPGMEHDEPNSVSLETTEQGVVIWKFTKSGMVDVACLKAGHFEAGMKGMVIVAGK